MRTFADWGRGGDKDIADVCKNGNKDVRDSNVPETVADVPV